MVHESRNGGLGDFSISPLINSLETLDGTDEEGELLEISRFPRSMRYFAKRIRPGPTQCIETAMGMLSRLVLLMAGRVPMDVIAMSERG
jgi:hypothetical protein